MYLHEHFQKNHSVSEYEVKNIIVAKCKIVNI